MSETSLPKRSYTSRFDDMRSRNKLQWSIGLVVLLFLMVLFHAGCSDIVTPSVENGTETDTVLDASETVVDISETTNLPEVTDASETIDLPEVVDSSDISDVSQTTDISDPTDTTDTPDTPASVKPRLIALGKDGRIASLQLTTPWTVLASGDLKQPTASARCFGGRCLVVHPSPADSISVVNPLDLSKTTKISLDRGADPRDVAFVDERTVVVSQYGKSSLLVIDLVSGARDSINLRGLADADGLPEMLRMAHCGRRVFVQLLRNDHTNGTPATMGAGLAVIDLDRKGVDRIVDADPILAGVQAIKLSGRPDFDMPVDCASGMLYLAEPKPLMKGGGWYEQVNLTTLTASKFPIDNGAQVGGFSVVAPKLYWFITHTATSPAGASSHLNLVGGSVKDTYNTFADQKVDELALDPDQELLFFPDNCEVKPSYPKCAAGVHVFHSRTGAMMDKGFVKLGFPPMELAISR